jgi:hypothetical protein
VGAPDPAPNAAGWNNTAVAIPYTASDNLSGVASASPGSPLTFTAEGASQTQSVTVTDRAGNSASFTSPRVNIDWTAPQVTASALPPRLPNMQGKMVPVSVSGTVSDALSGIDPATARASYAVADEYGRVQPSGAITVRADGNYAVTFR